MKLYVASSWRNREYSAVVQLLKNAGHEVYDFQEDGFNWQEGDPTFHRLTSARRFRDALNGTLQETAFIRDMSALINCDALVLVGPCGRSAHMEFGWAAGNGKHTVVLLPQTLEPELMYLMADRLCVEWGELLPALDELGARPARAPTTSSVSP